MYNNKTEKEKMLTNNTYGNNFRNYQAMKSLDIGGWDSRLTLRIGELYEDNNGRKVVNKDKTSLKVLGVKNVSLLEDMLDEVVSAIKNGESIPTLSFDCGTVTNDMVQICDGTIIDQEPGLYLVLYFDIDKETRTSSKIAFYKFNNKRLIKDYNAKTGEFDIQALNLGEIKDFRRSIKEFLKGSTMMPGHFVKEATKYKKVQAYMMLSAIAANLGVNGVNSMSGGGSGNSIDYDNKATADGDVIMPEVKVTY